MLGGRKEEEDEEETETEAEAEYVRDWSENGGRGMSNFLSSLNYCCGASELGTHPILFITGSLTVHLHFTC